MRYITESTSCSEEEVRNYVVQAIPIGEITYKVLNYEVDETPILSKLVLKGSKDNANSNKKKSLYAKLEGRFTGSSVTSLRDSLTENCLKSDQRAGCSLRAKIPP